MALMIAEVYSALIEAGASEAKAQAAAEAVAAYDNQLREIKQDVTSLRYVLERSVIESRVVRGIMITLICSFGFGILWRVW